MAIHIIYGPGGSGKSYLQIRLIVNELVRTRRNIVTNLAINLPELSAYVEKHHPDANCDVLQRVRILQEHETGEFWKHRAPLPLLSSDLWEGAEMPTVEIDKGRQGVLFVIDEAGVAGFSATGWAASDGRTTRGVACSWYLDQQRKFGDDVYASVNGRMPSGIAKPFRDKAHVFIKLKNGYLQTFGIFKAQGKFTAKYYAHEPDNSSEPFKIETWQMDETGIANCYRTQDGVGIVGVSADIGKKAKGIPILWAIPGAIALCLVVGVGIPHLFAKWVAGHADTKGKAKIEAVAEELKHDKPEQPKASDVVRAPLNATPDSAGTVRVLGVVRAGSRVTVQLSDGRAFTENEPFLRIERTFVECPAGVRYQFKSIEPRPLPPPGQKPDTPKETKLEPVADYRGESLFPPSESVHTLSVPQPMQQNAMAGSSRASAGPFRR